MSQSQSQSQSQVELVPDTPAVPSVHDQPLVDSYTWRSQVPKEARGVPCILGVDEAGRGPVLGPLVYGIAYCPASFSDQLKDVGFADSKTLTAERRDALLAALIQHPDQLGWATRTMSPQDISAGMLRRRPINLNTQSTEATVELISGVLASGVDISEIYVDTVGAPETYARTLKSYFPQAKYKHIQWTVTSKADSIYPIVGAASIAAKVTRDRWVEDWRYAEQVAANGAGGAGPSQSSEPPLSEANKVLSEISQQQQQQQTSSDNPPSPTKKKHSATTSGKKRKRQEAPVISSSDPRAFWHDFGSGYPGDPNTVAYLHRTLDPVFGWPGVVRFSWATIGTLLAEKSKSSTTTTTGQTRSSRVGTALAIAAADAVAAGGGGDDDKPSQFEVNVTGSRAPPAGHPRGYKIKWADEPAQITSFFSAKAGASAAGHAAVTASSGPQAIASALWKQNEDTLRKERKGIVKDLGLVSVGPGGMDGGL